MKQKLHLYKNNSSTWLFDDPEKDITAEPFVEGSSELITEVQAIAGFTGDKLSITFSDEPFSESQYTLIWKSSREEGTWNQYYSKELNMENWLCPVLLVYFDTPPKKLYVEMEESCISIERFTYL